MTELRRAIAALVVTSTVLSGAPAEGEEEPAPSPPTAAERVCALGARLAQVAEYERAAEALERCAELAGTDGPLADAIALRLGLGQRDAALRDVSVYLRTFGKAHPTTASRVVLALALHHEEHEEWARALEVLEARRELLRAAPLEVRIRAQVAKGRALLATDQGAQGLAELGAARALYGDGAAVAAEIEKTWPAESEAQHDRRLADVVRAVGQAALALADAARNARLVGLGPPTFAGPRTEAAVTAFVASKAPSWMEKRRAAIVAAEGAYLAVLDAKPFPPPGAVIAAASAIGAMWADYADDVARLVPGDGWPGSGDGRPPPAIARAVGELRAGVVRAFALPAMRKCTHYSVAYEFTDARSRACEAWLTKNDPEHVHAASELSPGLRVPPRAWVDAAPLRARRPSP
jgi:hypothetical protein